MKKSSLATGVTATLLVMAAAVLVMAVAVIGLVWHTYQFAPSETDREIEFSGPPLVEPGNFLL
ncbi:MAG: hypothetical protein AB7K24_33865 [Gemmataceae bacterium]